MAFESDWLELFPFTVTIHPYTGEDTAGKPTFGSSFTVAAYITDDVKRWRWEDGNEIESRRTVYFSNTAVTAKDKFVLPAGWDPQTVFPLVFVKQSDESGYHHTEVHI